MRGVSHTAVVKAVRSSRLSASVSRSASDPRKYLIDSDLADQEWVPGTQELMQTNRAVKTDAIEGVGDSKETYAKSRAMRETYAAKIAQLEYEVKSGKYVDAEEVRQAWVAVAGVVRSKFGSLPSKAKQQIQDLTIKQYETLEILVREILTDIADSDPFEQSNENEAI
jgi:phage terminase Nu1 subunit (DNA packaging protein)